MSIYSELEQLCRIKSINIEKNLALKIAPTKYNISELDSNIKNADALIFQSKNAVEYCKENYTSIKVRAEKNIVDKKISDKLDIYSIGKYSAKKVKELIGVSSKYNPKNFTSEGLIDIIKNSYKADAKFIIVKGLDGRNYIDEELKKRNIFVKSYYVYKREPVGLKINNSDLDLGTNYFIVNSLSALNELQAALRKTSSEKNKIAILPTKRIALNIDSSLFNNYVIINNAVSAEKYIQEIDRNEKK